MAGFSPGGTIYYITEVKIQGGDVYRVCHINQQIEFISERQDLSLLSIIQGIKYLFGM